MDRGKAHALPFLKDDARAQWDKELEGQLDPIGIGAEPVPLYPDVFATGRPDDAGAQAR